MKSISEPFLKRPVMTILVFLAVLVFGVYSFVQMPVSDLPDVDYPVIQVTASYPGASPEIMASNVASPLEQQFLKIHGIDLVTSNNSQGTTTMTLQFKLEVPVDSAATDVQAAINAAQGSLPPDLPSPPTFQKTNPNAQPIFYIGAISYSMTETQLYDYAYTEIVQRMQVLPGVSSVIVYGSPRAVRVEVDPEKLYTLGLTFNDISNAVKQGSNLIGIGLLKGKAFQFTIQPGTQLTQAADYAKLIIAYKDGSPIYLRDVAQVQDSAQQQDFKINFWSAKVPPGATGVVLAVSKADGANAVKVAQEVRDVLPELAQILPKSIQMVPIYDRSLSIVDSVHDVEETLIVAFVLVVMVVFVFLGRASDTLIPSIALPMALLVTFIVMHVLNYTLDNLSLMALTLSVGFLIDDAIVFLENMVRRMEAGEGVRQAAFNGAEEISFTIMAMTLSLASVFIPLVGMSGLMGRIFREMGVTIITAVIASGFVSLTLTPMLCARVLVARDPQKRTFFERVAYNLEHKSLAVYGPTLHWALKHWYLSVLAYAVCMAGIVYFWTIVPKSFLPVGDSSFISGVFIAPPSASPGLMRDYQLQADAVARQNPYVDSFVSVTGASSFFNSNLGVMFFSLKDPRHRPPIAAVSGMLNGGLAQIPGLVPGMRPQPVLQISTGGAPTLTGKYVYVMYGLDKQSVYQSALMLMGKMMQSGMFTTVFPDLYPNSLKLNLQLNRDQASQYGVTATGFSQLLGNAFAQNYSYLIKTDYLQYWTIVEAAEKFRARPDNLDWLYFPSLTNQSTLYTNNNAGVETDANHLVPFRAVAKAKAEIGPIAVNHYNGFTSVTLNFDSVPSIPIGYITKFVEDTAAQVAPPEVMRTFQGDALVFQQTQVSLELMLILAMFVMYVILGILYESYVHPFTVLSSVIVAVVGGLGALLVFHQELSLFAVIGLFMLAGLVKKNGIMMIDFAIKRQEEGRTPYDAVHEACLERFRPIIMTTLAAFFGALPLAVGLGADAASRIPLGLTVCGGLLVSQLITLYVTPVTYLGFEWVQERVLDRIGFFARGEPEPPVKDAAKA